MTLYIDLISFAPQAANKRQQPTLKWKRFTDISNVWLSDEEATKFPPGLPLAYSG